MTAKLILSMDGLVLKELPLAKERTTIGRKAHNDIQIDNLAISGEHAVIVTILSDSFLEDLNSTNGTYVNGQPIKKHFLQNNDVIELGKYRLKFVAEQPAPGAGSADYEKTLVVRPDMMRRPATEPAAARSPTDTQGGMPPLASPAPAAAPSPRPAPVAARPPEAPAPRPAEPAPAARPVPVPAPAMAPAAQASAPAAAGAPAAAPVALGVIQILSGVNAGKALELTKTLTTLGKPGVQVSVITRRPQGYFITHVEGAQMPVVNGKTIDPQAHPLGDHDVIELAGVKMEFFFKS